MVRAKLDRAKHTAHLLAGAKALEIFDLHSRWSQRLSRGTAVEAKQSDFFLRCIP